VSDNNIFLISGGVTYSILLALFPALAALVSIYGLLLDPGQIEQQVNAFGGVLPDQSRQMLTQELHQLASSSNGALSFGAVIALLFGLWTASRGMSGLISALDIAYEQKERRSFFRFNLVALVLTVGAIIGGTIAIALIGVLPAAVQFIGLGSTTKWILLILEWPLLIVLMMAGLAVLYRYGPDRREPQWRWASPGAITATVLWIVASIAFTAYVANFGSYDKTYGSLGGVVVLLTWLYLSAFVVLLGAVINAQAEEQTAHDTTTGDEKPLGGRGARAADTVASSPEG
jgi:membrane protein